MLKKYIAALCTAAPLLCTGMEKNLELLIHPEEISHKISALAEQVSRDYKEKPLTILMVMKGAVCVTADLIRKIDTPFKLEYLQASSYGQNGMVAGKLSLVGFDSLDIEDRDVLVVDDIFETGNTILKIIDQLKAKHPRSIKTFLLLVKNVPRNTSYRPDYVAFDIKDRFVVGYGLDYKELYRGLPGIYAFINDIPPF